MTFACAEVNNAPWVHDKAFQVIQKAGLGLTIHAGEVPNSLDYMRYAISIRADRIGHGVLLAMMKINAAGKNLWHYNRMLHYKQCSYWNNKRG